MAVNVDRYKASCKSLIAQITPHFLRGKKIMRLLAAICSPMDETNEQFVNWASSTVVDAVTTSQIIVLKWSMRTKLSQYFKDSDEFFEIDTYGRSSYTTAYETQSEQDQHAEAVKVYMPEYTTDNLQEAEVVVINDREELKDESNDLTIVAPAHNGTISAEEYRNKIRRCIEPYLAYSMEYIILIKE